jgi:hypothetical protein
MAWIMAFTKHPHLNSVLLHITSNIYFQHQRDNISSETQWCCRGTESWHSSYLQRFFFGRAEGFQSESRKSIQRPDKVLNSEGESSAILRDPCANFHVTYISLLPETLQHEPDVLSSDLPSYQ